jgi:hypothetical protein
MVLRVVRVAEFIPIAYDIVAARGASKPTTGQNEGF